MSKDIMSNITDSFVKDAVAHNETLGLTTHNGYYSCPTCRVKGRRFTKAELRLNNRTNYEKQNLFFPGIKHLIPFIMHLIPFIMHLIPFIMHLIPFIILNRY